MKSFFLKSLALLSLAFFSMQSTAQQFQYYYSNHPKFLNASNDTLPYPFTGGINSPQFSRIDLNNDGVKDLFVFDRVGNKVLTFLKTGNNGEAKYIYAPQFEHLFPKLVSWVLLVDMNGDGREDIFTNSQLTANARGIAVYKNTQGTNGYPQFHKLYDPLLCLPDTIWQPGWDDTIYNYTQVGNLYINIPVVTDVDDDGDIDIMSFGVGYNTLEFYMNFSQKLGLPKDSMKMKIVDRGWGYFAEGDTYDTVWLNVAQLFPKLYKQKHISGSALLLFDSDGDGDKEMLLSNGGYSKINYLHNGKKEYGTYYDTIVRYDSIWPTNTQRAKIPFFGSAYHVDVDNDGKRDMLVASNDNSEGKETSNIMYYKNNGADNSPVLSYQGNEFLCSGTFDIGGHSAPMFWDYDNDGDQDLFVSTTGDVSVYGAHNYRIFQFENIGSKNKPVYKLKNNDWLGLSSEKLRAIMPTMGDLNGDSKPDLLLGTYNGKLRYYQNTSSGSTITFSLQDSNYKSILVGDYSAPQIIDLDKDGLLDLVIGEAAGNINFYKNTGTSTAPSFTLVDDTLGNIILNEFTFLYEPPQYEFTGYAAPHFCDLNGDGKYELLAGNERGFVKLYKNIDNNLGGTFNEDSTFINIFGTSQFTRYSFGRYAKPFVAHLDNDTIPDIMIGNARGGLSILASSTNSGNIGIKPAPVLKSLIYVYPNPASDKVLINVNDLDGSTSIRIVNMLGQEIRSFSMQGAEGTMELNTSSLPQGVYFILSAKGLEQGVPVKLVISR